jgi:hypothetical protein
MCFCTVLNAHTSVMHSLLSFGFTETVSPRSVGSCTLHTGRGLFDMRRMHVNFAVVELFELFSIFQKSFRNLNLLQISNFN